MTTPDEELDRAARRYRRAQKSVERARDELAAAVVAANKAGTRPSTIARRVGLTPERVRQIIAAAGTDNDAPGAEPQPGSDRG